VVPFAIVAGEQDVDPRSSRGGDVVLDGDLHVVVDARPPQGVREAGVFVGPHRPIRRHAPGLPLEALDQPTFEPIEIDVLQKSAPRLGVDDHGGSIPYPRPVRGALAAAGDMLTAADLARHFKNAKAPRVEEILDTLVALGHARRTDSGYASA
jgi:hypothetical protein